MRIRNIVASAATAGALVGGSAMLAAPAMAASSHKADSCPATTTDCDHFHFHFHPGFGFPGYGGGFYPPGYGYGSGYPYGYAAPGYGYGAPVYVNQAPYYPVSVPYGGNSSTVVVYVSNSGQTLYPGMSGYPGGGYGNPGYPTLY